MAVSHALRRLLRIRELQEEQGKMALESALGELQRFENALAGTVERDRKGRRLVLSSAHSGELPDRLAGLEEIRAADRLAEALARRIEAAEQEVEGLRQEYLTKRVERRQAETLIDETEARDAIEASRRGQQALDDWHRSRVVRGLHKSQQGKRLAIAAPTAASAECESAQEETEKETLVVTRPIPEAGANKDS